MPRLGGDEGGVFRHPEDLDRAGLAVAVFEHDCLGKVRIFRFLDVIAFPVQRDDSIGILFDGAGLTQVGEQGAFILP